jgi:hypothetical protein
MFSSPAPNVPPVFALLSAFFLVLAVALLIAAACQEYTRARRERHERRGFPVLPPPLHSAEERQD